MGSKPVGLHRPSTSVLRFVLERTAPGDSTPGRNQFAEEVFDLLKAKGFLAVESSAAPLPEGVDIRANLAKHKLELHGDPSTHGELLLTFTGDMDEDGAIDFDIDSLQRSGVLAKSLRAEDLGVIFADRSQMLSFVEEGTIDIAEIDAGRFAAANLKLDGAAFQRTVPRAIAAANARRGPEILSEKADHRAKFDVVPVLLSGVPSDDALWIDSIGDEAPVDPKFIFTSVAIRRTGDRFEMSFMNDKRVITTASATRVSTFEQHGRSVRDGEYQTRISKPAFDAIMASLRESVGDQQLPEDHPLARYDSERAARAELRSLTEPPDDPGRRVVWRGATTDWETVREARAEDGVIAQKYGVTPRTYIGWIDQPRETEAARAFVDAARPGIPPDYLFAVAMHEGLGRHLDNVTSFTAIDLSQPVSGFQRLGLDDFGTRVELLRREGYLPDTFKEGDYEGAEPDAAYKTLERRNEQFVDHLTADFRDLPTGLTALSAALAQLRDQFEEDMHSPVPQSYLDSLPSDDAREEALDRWTQQQANWERLGDAEKDERALFFTYAYFNGGSAARVGGGRRQLYQSGHDFRNWPAEIRRNNRSVRFNTLEVMASLALLRHPAVQLFD